jgi:hypothetical protein
MTFSTRALFVVSIASLTFACSGSDAGGTSEPSTAGGDKSAEPGGSTSPGGSTTTTPPSSSTSSDPTPTPPAPASACGLPELTGVADVKPTFVVYDQAKGNVPAVMKGGKIDGKYKVDKATVFLPAGVKGLAKPASSTGTVNAWAIFDGASYRLSLKADLQIDSIIGPQPQKEDDAAQGTFTATSEKLKLDGACSGSTTPNAELSFSDQGARGILLVKTTVSQGDVYLQLEAAKQ